MMYVFTKLTKKSLFTHQKSKAKFLPHDFNKGILLLSTFLLSLLLSQQVYSQINTQDYYSQNTINISGTSGINSVVKNVAAVVDPGITVSAPEIITDFTVTITDSYQTGDILGYTGSLPSGVTARTFNVKTKSLVFLGKLSASDWQAVLRRVTIQTANIDCLPEKRKVTFLAAETYINPLNGNFYRPISTPAIWSSSKQASKMISYFGLQGYLVTITSAAENAFVSNFTGQDTWLGLSDNYLEINEAVGYSKYANQAASEGFFHWVTGPERGTQVTFGNYPTGPPFGVYANWQVGEPNNFSLPAPEHYGHMYGSNNLSKSGQWNDFSTQSISSVIEFGGMPNDDTSSSKTFTREVSVQGSSSARITGGEVSVCRPSNTTELTLTNFTGTVVRWESSLDNFITAGSPISTTASTLTVSNLSQTTYYRAVVNSTSPSACTGLVSASTVVRVTAIEQANILAIGGNTICQGGEVGLVVSGNTGTVEKWQKSTDGFTWTDIVNTTVNYSEVLNTIGTVTYRAVVGSSCGPPLFTRQISVTVQAGTPPVGGFVSSNVHTSTLNSGSVTLSGHTGTILRWQSSETNGLVWVDLLNSLNPLAYGNISRTTLFRAVVQNGSCGFTYSAPGQVSILTPSITVAGSIEAFNSCDGAASPAQTLTVSGVNLTGNIAISALQGFEYSLDGNTYAATLDLTRSGSSVNATTLYIRMIAGATGNPSGTVSFTSTGAPTRTISTNGNSPAPVPVGTNGSRTSPGTVTLTASASSGNTIDWYAAATGGSPLASGTTSYTTPSITTTTVYYAETRNTVSGCISPTRTAVTAAIIKAPVITSFASTTAGNGESVVITGTGLSGVTIVRFGTVNATSFVINSDTQITAVVGAARSGDVYVQNAVGTDTEAGFVFKIVEYKFENNVLDGTNSSKNGTVSGVITYGSGFEGRSICFDRGSNNWVSLPDNLIKNLTDFTISMRFKTTSKGVMLGYQNNIINSLSANQFIPILVVQSDGKLRGTLWTTANRDMSVVSPSVVNDGNWHRVDMSVTTTSINIYLDGLLVGSNSSGTVDHLSMSFNQLGRGRTDTTRDSQGGDLTGWQGFTGCIDNFTILDKGQTLTQINQSTAAAIPTITSFAPTTAKSGEALVITGTNLSGASDINIGGVAARSFTVVSSTEILAIVPKDALATTNVQVISGGITVSAPNFTFDCGNNAIDFDGVNDHVVLGDVIENFTVFSQEAWVYWKGSSEAYSEIFTKENISTFAITSSNKLHANFGSGGTWGAGVNSATSIPLNTWTHVAITRSAIGTVKLYINGVLDANTATLLFNGGNTNSRVIGAKLVGSTLFGPFTGAIDELKAWNTERTAAQILAGLGTELVGNEPGLMAYYNFNQGTPSGTNTTLTTLNNLTATANLTGTLTNMAKTGATSNFIQGVWPVILTQPVATVSLCAGQGISVSALGQQLTYQWYSNSSASNAGGTAVTGQTSATLTIPNSATGTNYYYVVVSSACSQAVSSAVSTVTVVDSPVLTYPTAIAVERTLLITSLTPTVSGGTISSYAISPGLPSGLVISSTTGVISGTPSVNSTSRTYTVTGTTASGCTSIATFTLEVFSAVAPSALSYDLATQTVRQGTAITATTPTVSGGTATFTISPALPAGLSIHPTTGVISGTLTSAQTGTVTHTITATNSGGSTTVTISLVYNTAPSNIALSPAAVAENAASGTTVGILSATDPDTGDTFTYALVSGTGSTDNASFAITGATLTTAAVFDFETKSSYSVRVRVTDAGGLTFERTLTITVTNVNEAPTAAALSAAILAENAASGTTVGTLSATDIDANDTFTFTLVSGSGSTDNASFTIDGTSLKSAAVFDFETKSSYSIRVRVTDAGGLTFERTLNITVTDVNEDRDGDGVRDNEEVADGTNPLNACSFKLASQNATPSDAWKAADCDNDGLTNQQEKDLGTNPSNGDSDGDGVPDGVEVAEGTSPLDKSSVKDTDGDGVPNFVENVQGTNPNDAKDAKDSDGDGVPDYVEVQQGTDPNDPADAKDTDGDGVPDYVETVYWPIQGLPAGNPNAGGEEDRDTDGDGVPDYQEVLDGTDPKDGTDSKDTDGDSVPDYIELQQGTNPNDPDDATDTDGDGVPDYVETVLWPNQGLPKGDPTNPADGTRDTDGDGVPDYQEVIDGTDPKDATDAKDSDGDGVPDSVEVQQGTNPNNADDAKDTDGDGVPDYVETVLWPNQGLPAGNPTNPADGTRDTDGDGVPDYQEVLDGTDPKDATDSKDTDGDGVPDYIELAQGTNPNSASDAKDTDGDGVPDYVETVLWPNLGLPAGNPNVGGDQDRDTDGDGVPDYIEVQQGTNPNDGTDTKDSDGDGVPDYIEVQQGTNPNNGDDSKDTDGDGVPDYVETVLWPNQGLPAGNPNVGGDQDRDTDGDGVPDYQEVIDGTDPADGTDTKDSDGDGVPDYIEIQQGTDPNDPEDAKDTDGDGVPDYVETVLWPNLGLPAGNPNVGGDQDRDTDGDGVPDYIEVQQGTDPTDATDTKDSDGDGVPDHIEVAQGTDPNDPADAKDTDGDGVPDYVETVLWPNQGLPAGNPNAAGDQDRDTDGDGVPDYIEVQQGSNPSNATDAKDSDGDGVPDYLEVVNGTDINNPKSYLDTDGDSVPDFVETQQGTSPSNASDFKDSDGDGIPDYVENVQGTDSSDPSDFKDTDGDGVPDYVEVQQGTNPTNASDAKDTDGDGVADHIQFRSIRVSKREDLVLVWGDKNYLAALPKQVEVTLFSGTKAMLDVTWISPATINILKRGTYELKGTLALPKGVYNSYLVNGLVRVVVLPKPAPRDVTINNSTFTGSTTQFFLPVGGFVVNDPVDNIHVVSLFGDGYDNTYFEIKNNILFWSSADRASGKTKFSIVVRVLDRDGNTIEKFFEITRTRAEFTSLVISSAFTPNGDGANEAWGVPALRFYQGVRLQVFDKGGERVFYTENPDQRWDGTFEGKTLAVGSYYWTIEILETGEMRKGMLNLLRK